jgi:hypothetical protein
MTLKKAIGMATKERNAVCATTKGARLWSQTQPQHFRRFESAAAGASRTAALRLSLCDLCVLLRLNYLWNLG